MCHFTFGKKCFDISRKVLETLFILIYEFCQINNININIPLNIFYHLQHNLCQFNVRVVVNFVYPLKATLQTFVHSEKAFLNVFSVSRDNTAKIVLVLGKEGIQGINRFSGEELWKTSWVGAMKVPFFASRNGSWIRSTPAVDEASIYVAGMRDVLTCLHAETGKVRWSVDFKERFKTSLPAFGCPSSPLLTKTHVYVQAGAGLVKLDKETGATIWRTTLDSGDSMSGGAFSSPVMATLGGIPQLVVQSRTELAGISIDDGAILWSTAVKAFRGMNILTPTIFGEAVFTSAYGGRAHLFQVDGNEGGLDIRVGWEASTQGYMTSPVVRNGTAYLFLKSNRFGCLDLETGAKGWTSPPTGDSYWSLAIQGNRILSLSDSGVLRLIGAEPGGYRVISEREISEEETWAHIAPAGKQVFVRSQQSLIALNWL